MGILGFTRVARNFFALLFITFVEQKRFDVQMKHVSTLKCGGCCQYVVKLFECLSLFTELFF